MLWPRKFCIDRLQWERNPLGEAKRRLREDHPQTAEQVDLETVLARSHTVLTSNDAKICLVNKQDSSAGRLSQSTGRSIHTEYQHVAVTLVA